MRAVADPALSWAGFNGPFADGPEENGYMHSMVGTGPQRCPGIPQFRAILGPCIANGDNAAQAIIGDFLSGGLLSPPGVPTG